MHFTAVRRAAIAAAAIALLGAPTALAETLSADGDVLTPAVQTTVDLGTVAPGQDVDVKVSFVLECSGTSHIDAGQSVRLTPGARIIPPGGSYGVGSLTFAPPTGWPADGESCPTGLAPAIGGPIDVIVTAPVDPGTGYLYSFTWNRSLMPVGSADSDTFGPDTTTVVFLLNVATNTPPSLVLPSDLTVEGDATGGAIAAYSVSATDAEDLVPPTPACTPATGSLLALGPTTVDCAVTDGGGLTTTGSFVVTVVDTTAARAGGHAR